jgi:hypothetical protein
MALDRTFALSCWTKALGNEFGLRIVLESVDDIGAARYDLYQARQKSGNKALDRLVLCLPGDALNEIWLVKRPDEKMEI